MTLNFTLSSSVERFLATTRSIGLSMLFEVETYTSPLRLYPLHDVGVYRDTKFPW